MTAYPYRIITLCCNNRKGMTVLKVKKSLQFIDLKLYSELNVPFRTQRGQKCKGFRWSVKWPKALSWCVVGGGFEAHECQIRGIKCTQIICSEPFNWFVVFYVLQRVHEVYKCFVSTEIVSLSLFNWYCYCNSRRPWQLPAANKCV